MHHFPRVQSADIQKAISPADASFANRRGAVLVPCYNEAATIDTVVRDFRRALPHAEIYVFDNDSNDDTLPHAQAAGAQVRTVPYRGKGNVIRRMPVAEIPTAYGMRPQGLHTGFVPRLPTAVLCTALMLLSAILLACGIILDTVTRGRIGTKRFAYLSVDAPRPAAKQG
jgi:cellulose synthase/poly-beta-1,6-N-acetylglucosamine synthase-like glycosyltransferase